MPEKELYIGLNDQEVEESRERDGRNVLTPPYKTSIWKLFLEKFNDPLIIILGVICVFALGVSIYEYVYVPTKGPEAFVEPLGIFVAILLATGLSFHFERKAQKEFNLLNQENDLEKYPVVRNGNVVEVPKCDIVVGDILVLQTGQEVPADAELLESVNLQIDESSLTGEPVHSKFADPSLSKTDSTYPTNKIYRGTYIMEGHGYAKVFAVGDNTENGRIMMSLTGVEIEDDRNLGYDELDDTQRKALRLQKRNKITHKVRTPLNEQLRRLSRLITNISYIIAGAIIVGKLLVYFEWDWRAWILLPITAGFFWMVITKFEKFPRWKCILTIIVFFTLFIGMVIGLHYWPGLDLNHKTEDLIAYSLVTIMIAVTLVVVAVPEGLPMAVSLSLANSMRKMLKTNNLVRKMHACETMGATTVILTDKTGTLTQNQMQVRAKKLDRSLLLYEGIAVNSTAALDFSHPTPRGIGNPTECALLLWLHSKGQKYPYYRVETTRIAEVPFSTELKYMATCVKSCVHKGQRILYVKGAPEIVLDMCTSFSGDHTREEYEQTLLEYQKKAMRTLGFAYKFVSDDEKYIEDGKVVANDLIFMGVVGIEDPIRDDVKDAVDQFIHAGIEIKIVTGDTMATACEIGRQIGIWDDSCTERNAIDGPTLALLSDEELVERVNELKIIARARPMDKKRLVEALQAKNHVVAVTGDGTNDAPALNAAHVGLSMGSGTSVAKEASDITIKDNSFASIARAVKWGRSLYQNIQRFLLYQLTVNVAACLLVLCGAFMGLKSPLTVTQMLWVNLIMDTFAAFALSGLPPTDKVMDDKPRSRKAFILVKDLLKNIFGVGLAFSVLLIGLLYFFQHFEVKNISDIFSFKPNKDSFEKYSYEPTLLFTIFVMTHFWYLFNARAFKTGKSGFNLKGCQEFWIIAAIIFIGQILIVQVPVLNKFFNVESLSLSDWLIIGLGSALVVAVREIYAFFKHKRIRKSGIAILALIIATTTVSGCRKANATNNAENTTVETVAKNPPLFYTKTKSGVPEQIVVKKSYIASYNKETRIPNWVGWHLTAEHADGEIGRINAFHEEESVPRPRALSSDYKGSGWSRGHMCPAGDNKWDRDAMYDTFSYVNICPQNANLNNGLWNSIEMDCRRWAKQYGDIYIVCGPIFYRQEHKTIGDNKVYVPEAFFKVVLCLKGKPKAFGFVVKNTDGNKKRDIYYHSIDEVERITGHDFFYLLTDNIETVVETKANIEDWR